jgi:hypothetical protein
MKTVPITKLLARLGAPGTFATRLGAPAADLEIEVKGVGSLTFPITTRQAQKLKSVARPSPFGLREQTLHDPSVRSTWEIAGSRVKIGARRWKPVLASALRSIQSELGFPDECELEAVFDKLLVYEEGQFFKPHQDSEKDDEMVATLVVILPSQYEGGAVTVERTREKKVFRRVARQTRELSLLAFYADCHHAVSPIKSGVRVALTYQLRLAKRGNSALPKARPEMIEPLRAALHAHFTLGAADGGDQVDKQAPERFVYLLDHEYTQRSLSWTKLKNGDRVRAGALRTVAERLDCECFLTLADIHESWSCEDDYSDDGYRRRGSRYMDHTREPEVENIQLIELMDGDIALDHWLDANGQRIEGVPGTASYAELHFTTPSSDMQPYKTEHEGYQGNYGNTVDRWYHRAALVMWPRANSFSLRAQASPQWAVGELLAMPHAAAPEIESRVSSLLPHWKHTARHVESLEFSANVVELSARIDDAALAREWLAPLGLRHFKNKVMRRRFAALVDKHGLPWAKELLAAWTRQQHDATPAWAPLLADICADLRASKSRTCEALSTWLLERETRAVLDRCASAFEQRAAWLDLTSFEHETKHVAHVLAAAAAVSAHHVVTDALHTLVGGKHSVPLSFLVQLTRACLAKSAALKAYVIDSVVHRECAERLALILSAPTRAEDDWTISFSLHCDCADCKELSSYLSSSRRDHDWPLNEYRRSHIHAVLDAANLPVRHTTLRRGSPFVLQLRKDKALFSREKAYLDRLRQIRSALSM